MQIRSLRPLTAVALSLLAFGALSAQAAAGDAKALAQGFKDEEACNEPYAKSLDGKAFITCLNALAAGYKGTEAAQQSYIAGVGFNAWSLANIVAVLAVGGATPAQLVSMTWYVTDIDEYVARQKDIGRAYRDVIGRHFPAMALVQVVRLVEPRAKVEIQAIAVL